MSKEMMIVFIYDTECCQSEEDDPASAVLYFHPNWVSDHQRLALVGQLMGTTHFLSSVFSTPKMITLESGKFAIRMFTSRYILAVGTDRNLADWVINHRADILCSLIRLYHYNIDLILQVTSTKTFKEKLYQFFETYLPVLLFGGNTFTNAPTMQLPKSASNVFLEAIQILQCCQDIQGILGGVIFYHNKVVATQLNADVTKLLVMTDPYRIKCTAECINPSFELPEGVQLLQVYVSKKEYERLKNLAKKYKTAFETNLLKKQKKGFASKSVSTKDPVLTAMKRDKSIIFSTVPEEDTDISPQPFQKKKFIERPRSLSLFSTTADVINEKRVKIQTPFRSQASVCSTPITEKVLHGNVMSICCNPDEDVPRSTPIEEVDVTQKFTEIIKKDFEKKSAGKIMQEFKNNLTKFSVTMKTYGIGLRSLPTTPKKEPKISNSNTITDPTFPIIGINGLPISKCLYQEQVLNNLEIEAPAPEPPPPLPAFEPPPPLPEFEKIEFKKRRHSLNLPLKSLTMEDDTSPVRKFTGGGVQLTPLLSKLTILALDEKSGMSRDATPSFEYRDLSIPLFKKRVSEKDLEEENGEAVDDNLEKVTLFICGQQNMVLMVLLENDLGQDEEVVVKLHEICINNLNQLESHVHQCIDPCSNAATDITVDPYSYMSLDQKWDVIQRGGPWGVPELSILTQLHNNFMETRNLCEIIVRNDDSIIYGYRHSQTELFYHQNTTNTNAGLPPPADLMGTVPLKARRRLERDHAIILL